MLLVLSVYSCSNSTDEPKEDMVSRAVLVYMLADNSLGSAGYDTDDLAEMLTAARNGDLDDGRLIVYHASTRQAPILKEITAEGERVLKVYDYTPLSVSSQRMNEVIQDFKNTAPAQNYGLILWSHASGWIENGIEENLNGDNTPNSFGEERGRKMNITTLASILDDKGFDYICFDCCYMANVESLYEIRNSAPIVMAYSTEIPAPGMPYDLTLKYLMKPNVDLKGAARATFDYYDALSGADRTCTVSVIDLTKLSELALATKAVFSSSTPASDLIPQQFMTSGCYLFDMNQYVNSFNATTEDMKRWNDAFRATVKLSLATPRLWNYLPLDNAHGLSTYILNAEKSPEYQGYNRLQWWHDVASHINFN